MLMVMTMIVMEKQTNITDTEQMNCEQLLRP